MFPDPIKKDMPQNTRYFGDGMKYCYLEGSKHRAGNNRVRKYGQISHPKSIIDRCENNTPARV